MKIIRLVVFMFVTASTYAQEPLSDEKQILKLEDDWVRALETKDWKLLDTIVARDFTFIEPDGTVKNRESISRIDLATADIESFENVDLKARVFGNCALASGVAKITERRQGKHYRFSLRWKELWLKDKPPSSTKGPPIKIKPSATSRSINSACSSQKGCSRVLFDKSRFGPAEEITTNVFFIAGKPQASVHPVQPRMFH
jgi:ketosteroid isomerase-like protein